LLKNPIYNNYYTPMARTTDPNAKKMMAFFTETEQRDIKADMAKLGKSFTDYILYLRNVVATRVPRVADLLKKPSKKGGK